VKDVDSCMSLDSSMVCVDGKALGDGKKIEKYYYANMSYPVWGRSMSELESITEFCL